MNTQDRHRSLAKNDTRPALCQGQVERVSEERGTSTRLAYLVALLLFPLLPILVGVVSDSLRNGVTTGLLTWIPAAVCGLHGLMTAEG